MPAGVMASLERKNKNTTPRAQEFNFNSPPEQFVLARSDIADLFRAVQRRLRVPSVITLVNKIPGNQQEQSESTPFAHAIVTLLREGREAMEHLRDRGELPEFHRTRLAYCAAALSDSTGGNIKSSAYMASYYSESPKGQSSKLLQLREDVAKGLEDIRKAIGRREVLPAMAALIVGTWMAGDAELRKRIGALLSPEMTPKPTRLGRWLTLSAFEERASSTPEERFNCLLSLQVKVLQELQLAWGTDQIANRSGAPGKVVGADGQLQLALPSAVPTPSAEKSPAQQSSPSNIIPLFRKAL